MTHLDSSKTVGSSPSQKLEVIAEMPNIAHSPNLKSKKKIIILALVIRINICCLQCFKEHEFLMLTAGVLQMQTYGGFVFQLGRTILNRFLTSRDF